MTPMTDHFEHARNHRDHAVQARADLDQLHAASRTDDARHRRMVAAAYDRQRFAVKLAEVDALLSIAQGLRDLRNTLEAGR